MRLSQIESLLRARLANPLPGEEAHQAMRARPVDKPYPVFHHKLPPRPGSVLILLYEDSGKVYFPLIRRQEYVGAHSGQVSLPGGKTEPGESAIETALRETEEEVGIDRRTPHVLGALSNFLVLPSNFMITPIVATLDHVPDFMPNPHEVASIFSASLELLLSRDAIVEAEIMAAGQYKMMAPHFLVEGAMVWGATAMMLNEFRIVVRETLETGD